MAELEIDDERIAAVCRVLNEHRVDFRRHRWVAARLHDTGHATVDIDVPVASLVDVVRSKRAAGRPKDIVALPALEARVKRPLCLDPASDPRLPQRLTDQLDANIEVTSRGTSERTEEPT